MKVNSARPLTFIAQENFPMPLISHAGLRQVLGLGVTTKQLQGKASKLCAFIKDATNKKYLVEALGQRAFDRIVARADHAVSESRCTYRPGHLDLVEKTSTRLGIEILEGNLADIGKALRGVANQDDRLRGIWTRAYPGQAFTPGMSATQRAHVARLADQAAALARPQWRPFFPVAAQDRL